MFTSFLLCICNIYLPNSVDLSTELLIDLVNQLPKPFIILGDFNSHSTDWGCRTSNTRGHIMTSFTEQHNLVVLNSGDSTHFSMSHQTFSAIALTLCTPDIAHLFDWKVFKDPCGSDHFPITLNSYVSDKTPRRFKWNYNKANWEKFQSYLMRT